LCLHARPLKQTYKHSDGSKVMLAAGSSQATTTKGQSFTSSAVSVLDFWMRYKI